MKSLPTVFAISYVPFDGDTQVEKILANWLPRSATLQSETMDKTRSLEDNIKALGEQPVYYLLNIGPPSLVQMQALEQCNDFLYESILLLPSPERVLACQRPYQAGNRLLPNLESSKKSLAYRKLKRLADKHRLRLDDNVLRHWLRYQNELGFAQSYQPALFRISDLFEHQTAWPAFAAKLEQPAPKNLPNPLARVERTLRDNEVAVISNAKAVSFYEAQQSVSIASVLETLSLLPSGSDKTEAPVLISLHFSSKRPGQVKQLFDNVMATAEKPDRVEFCIHTDGGHTAMADFLGEASSHYPFRIVPYPYRKLASFTEINEPLNDLINITHPDAIFCMLLSDEMRFKTPGWDRKLAQYQGIFPDNLFRLRTSRMKLRNYSDLWECGFCQDSSPIVTRQWLEKTGGWGDHYVSDAYQQLVAHYLRSYDCNRSAHIERDIPAMDIEMAPDHPGLLGSVEQYQERWARGIRAWFDQIVSIGMHRSTRHAAARIRAEIENARLEGVMRIEDDKRMQCVIMLDDEGVVNRWSYRLPTLRFYLIHQVYRRFYYRRYLEKRGISSRVFVLSTLSYLNARYPLVKGVIKGAVRTIKSLKGVRKRSQISPSH